MKPQNVKLFSVLFLSTIFIYSFSFFGNQVFSAIRGADGTFAEGTFISGVDLSGKTGSDGAALLSEKIAEWQQGTSYTVHYKENSSTLDLSLIRFDVEGTINGLSEGTPNPLQVSLDMDGIGSLIADLSSDLVLEETENEDLSQAILQNARDLLPGEHAISLDSLLAESRGIGEMVVSESSLPLKDARFSMGNWVETLSPIAVPAHSQVSLLNVIEEKQMNSISSEGMSIIASAVYRALLPTNFIISERHTGQVLPDYIQPGFEAKVIKDRQQDFVFENPNESEYRIELGWNGSELTVKLIGSSFLNKYEMVIGKTEEVSPRTIIQYSPQLASGESSVKQNGEAGKMVSISRKVVSETGKVLSENVIAKDFYPPVERIVIHGLKQGSSVNPGTEITVPEGTAEAPAEGAVNPDMLTPEAENEEEPETVVSDSGDGQDSDFWGKENEQPK